MPAAARLARARRPALIARIDRRRGRATRPGAASAPRPRRRRSATIRANARGGSTSTAPRTRSQAGREQRAPVDRHDEPRPEQGDRARGRGGSMCPGPSDGPHPQIGSSATSCRPASAAMPGKTSVSPAKYTRVRAGDLEAERLGHGPERVAPAVVLGLDRRHRRARRPARLADAELGHAGEPGAPQHGARAAGRDDRARRGRARRSDGTSRWSRCRCETRTASSPARACGSGRGPWRTQVRRRAAQHRIGEQARAADLERHGGVPDPGDPLRAGHAHTLREPRASAPHPRG